MRNRVVISLILLIIWTILVLTNNTIWFDDLVYNFIISFKSEALTTIMVFITGFSNAKLLVILSLITLIALIWKRKEPLYIVGTLSFAVVLNQILKYLIRRPRPSHLRLITESGFSYPSGHAMASTAFYGAMVLLLLNSSINKKVKYLLSTTLIILIILIGISRIYLGVHYPSDIIGGWLISYLILHLLILVRSKYEGINNRSK